MYQNLKNGYFWVRLCTILVFSCRYLFVILFFQFQFYLLPFLVSLDSIFFMEFLIKNKFCDFNFINLFYATYHCSIPLENRKAEVFLCFQCVKKGTSGMRHSFSHKGLMKGGTAHTWWQGKTKI